MSGEELRAAPSICPRCGGSGEVDLATPEPSGHKCSCHYGTTARCASCGCVYGPAPSTEPALDADQQFTAVDKSLLATFQWSDKDYQRFGLAASAFLNHLHDIGWDVTVRDPEKAAEYARLAESR